MGPLPGGEVGCDGACYTITQLTRYLNIITIVIIITTILISSSWSPAFYHAGPEQGIICALQVMELVHFSMPPSPYPYFVSLSSKLCHHHSWYPSSAVFSTKLHFAILDQKTSLVGARVRENTFLDQDRYN